jgi:soluble lytic murein transglycosylase-like protein
VRRMTLAPSRSSSKAAAAARLLSRAAIPVLLLCAAAPAAHAEYIVLRSGGRLHVSGYERIGETLRLHIAGGTVDVAAADVVSIEPEEVFAAVARPDPPAPPPLNVPYAKLIHAAAMKYGLDEKLVASVVAAESNFDRFAVSYKNALGLMQLLPQTARDLAVSNPFDPAQNIDAGAHYLRVLLDKFGGNVALALAAYNAGPDRVTEYGGVPPYRETQEYVQRVKKNLANTSAASAPKAPPSAPASATNPPQINPHQP